MHVTQEARRSILVDLLTVHALGGKAIVFTQTKREADEVAASLSLVHPCEVSTYVSCCTSGGHSFFKQRSELSCQENIGWLTVLRIV